MFYSQLCLEQMQGTMNNKAQTPGSGGGLKDQSCVMESRQGGQSWMGRTEGES